MILSDGAAAMLRRQVDDLGLTDADRAALIELAKEVALGRDDPFVLIHHVTEAALLWQEGIRHYSEALEQHQGDVKEREHGDAGERFMVGGGRE